MPRTPELSPLQPTIDQAKAPLHVLVGIVTDAAGRVLIAQRSPGKPMAGEWEFPGGKRGPNEARLVALRRELAEELAINVNRAEPFLDLVVEYPDRPIRLDVWWVNDYTGVARSNENQAIRWVSVDQLAKVPILAADAPIIGAIQARSENG